MLFFNVIFFAIIALGKNYKIKYLTKQNTKSTAEKIGSAFLCEKRNEI